jgi:hypothetical protein
MIVNTSVQEQMKKDTEKYLNMVDVNSYRILCCEKNKEPENQLEHKQKEEKMMEEIKASPIATLFTMLLIAEFKELVYESIFFPHFDQYDNDRMCGLERVIKTYYGDDVLENHIHDPEHFLFNDGRHHYMFYERYEAHGTKILDVDIDDILNDYENGYDSY